MVISRPMMMVATRASVRSSWTSMMRGRRHHQLVGHRVEEGAEGRGLVEPARQIAVGPVGDGGGDEDRGCGQDCVRGVAQSAGREGAAMSSGMATMRSQVSRMGRLKGMASV